jgi:hypothetical protein
MLRTLTAGLLATAAMGFAGSAMAQQIDNQNYNVNVNIEVAEEVSVWSDDLNISLLMNGADGNNSATAESSIKYINNVDANIQVLVDGTLPTPSVPGGGINFFVFDGVNATGAVAAITSNAYNPAGALVWTESTLGTSQELDDSVGVNNSAVQRLITYASASPGELPDAASYDLDVTYTIAANGP